MHYRIIIALILSIIICSCSENNPTQQNDKKATTNSQQKKNIEDKKSHTNKKPLEEEKQDIQTKNLLDKNTFQIDTLDLVLGNREAEVILIEYSSPTCPHCSYFHKEVLPKLKEKYLDTGKIAYVLREFVTNKQDLDAAMLGRCYKNKEDPLKLLNLLYIQQDSWAFNKNYREILINLGGLAGVSREEYMKCMGRKEIVDFLLKHAKSISTYPGFIGTPAFFINGEMHKGVYSFEGLSKVIDQKLDSVATKEVK